MVRTPHTVPFWLKSRATHRLYEEEDIMAQKRIPVETPEQTAGRLEQVLPYTWEVLQRHPFPQTVWEKVNDASPYAVGPLVDKLEEAAKALAKQLRVSPKQATLILIETCFQRLD
jgi:hypothetical protein